MIFQVECSPCLVELQDCSHVVQVTVTPKGVAQRPENGTGTEIETENGTGTEIENGIETEIGTGTEDTRRSGEVVQGLQEAEGVPGRGTVVTDTMRGTGTGHVPEIMGGTTEGDGGQGTKG